MSSLNDMQADLAPSLPDSSGSGRKSRRKQLENTREAVRDRFAERLSQRCTPLLEAALRTRLAMNKRLGVAMPARDPSTMQEVLELMDGLDGDEADLPIMQRPLAISSEELSFFVRVRCINKP
jgi:hypothetical protein